MKFFGCLLFKEDILLLYQNIPAMLFFEISKFQQSFNAITVTIDNINF